MAAVAAHAVRGVRGMVELRLLAAGLVALQAACGVFLRIAVERENELAGGRRFGVIAVRGLFRVRVRFNDGDYRLS